MRVKINSFAIKFKSVPSLSTQVGRLFGLFIWIKKVGCYFPYLFGVKKASEGRLIAL